MSIPNAIFMNGPKVGQVITLPDPLPQRVTVGIMVHLCKHRPEQSDPFLHIEYDVCTSDNPMMPISLITKDKTIASGYYCMECKADAEAKYKLEKVRDTLNELLEEEEYLMGGND